MLRAGFLVLVAGLFVSNSAAACGCSDGAQMGGITAQLFYKNSGRLSDDLIARDPAFVGWNTVIGEGDAEEPAEDLLVTVSLVGSGEEAFLDDKLELWVEDDGGAEIARRDFYGILLPYEGEVRNPLWLSDAGCAGDVTIHARFRGKEKTARLSLQCGE